MALLPKLPPGTAMEVTRLLRNMIGVSDEMGMTVGSIPHYTGRLTKLVTPHLKTKADRVNFEGLKDLLRLETRSAYLEEAAQAAKVYAKDFKRGVKRYEPTDSMKKVADALGLPLGPSNTPVSQLRLAMGDTLSEGKKLQDLVDKVPLPETHRAIQHGRKLKRSGDNRVDYIINWILTKASDAQKAEFFGHSPLDTGEW